MKKQKYYKCISQTNALGDLHKYPKDQLYILRVLDLDEDIVDVTTIEGHLLPLSYFKSQFKEVALENTKPEEVIKVEEINDNELSIIQIENILKIKFDRDDLDDILNHLKNELEENKYV